MAAAHTCGRPPEIFERCCGKGRSAFGKRAGSAPRPRDGFPLESYPADGFAQGWVVDRPGTLVVRYGAPPIWLLWSIVGCALAAALAMTFAGQKNEKTA